MKKKILISLLLVITILTAIFSTVYATDEEIPTTYDLRNDINIKVESQRDEPLCIYYAETKMIETYIQKIKGITYNLFNETTKKEVIKDFKYLKDVKNNTEKMKEYIISYGGIFMATTSDTQFYNYKGGIYRKTRSQQQSHAVIIIGWDDNYSKDNFYYEKPEKDGAWLILNSWGSNWANKGTAWVSYEDIDKPTDVSAIKSLTLSNGETIETKLEDEKQEEIKETETPVINQEIIESNKTSNIQNIFIIVFTGAVILLIIGIILKSKKHK